MRCNDQPSNETCIHRRKGHDCYFLQFFFKLWNEEINARKIIPVKDATYAVVKKRKPEIFRLVHLPFPGILQINLMTSSWLVCQLNLSIRVAEATVQIPVSLNFFRLSFCNWRGCTVLKSPQILGEVLEFFINFECCSLKSVFYAPWLSKTENISQLLQVIYTKRFLFYAIIDYQVY